MAPRSYKTEAVVLRSFRLGEADRVLHLYTLDRGRVGAVAKGVRKTTSRFGARLEPLSHSALMLHQGSGDLQTVTGADLVRPHSATREDYYRLSVGLIGAEAMLRLFSEQEANERAFTALTRFLDVLDEAPTSDGRPALDPLVLSFQLKLLWLSGYLPHLTSCAECGARRVADERDVAGAALRAARQVRQVAGQPEQLELEREHERVERRAALRDGRLVQDVEEAREGGEGALVRLLLAEETEHRLGADEADREAVVVLACRAVRPDELGAGDGLEVAGALVEHQGGVRERLEARAEARLRLPDALGDRADTAAVERVEVEHAVGLAEPERPEDDGLGLVGAGGHIPFRLSTGTDCAVSAF